MSDFLPFVPPDLAPWMLLLMFGLTFAGTIILVPWAVVRLPADYFTHPTRHRELWKQYPRPVRILMVALKNLLGFVLVLAGISMLVLPGQGLLTILIGFFLLDFPGRFRFVRWLVCHKPVLHSINWLRQKQGKPPLQLKR